MPVHVLELGSYLVPAYAGMVLAEQGITVTKWWSGRDPLLELALGDELWAWANEGKHLQVTEARRLAQLERVPWQGVIDNIRPSTWARWDVSPAILALAWGVPWISVVADEGERSFDVIAQARAWGDHGPWVPFYIGDTAVGLWLAFKVTTRMAQGRIGHESFGQAAALAKLVEGEERVPAARDGRSTPWDRDLYRMDEGGAEVEYRSELVAEPRRDRAWRLAHLAHERGRFRV